MNSSVTLDEKRSPMMEQWHACKEKAKNAIVLFRLGDFYEAFYDDAIAIAKQLNLTLTKRQDVPMAGVPAHTSEGYIDKLVAKGYSVAIAEQMENPKQAKGIVKREIVRTITPGTLVNSSLLSDKANNYIISLALCNQIFGLAILDVTTAEFRVFECETVSVLYDEITRLHPKELLISEKCFSEEKEFVLQLKSQLCFSLQVKEDWHFDPLSTYRFLLNHFQMQSLDGFGLQEMGPCIHAAGALLSYVQDELHLSIQHIQSLRRENQNLYMSLDSTTLRHLEIIQPLHEKQTSFTLLNLLDQTDTPMGGRLLKYWLLHPLLTTSAIQERQDAIDYFMKAPSEDLSLCLMEVRDLERLIMRIETGFANPKDIAALCLSLEQIPKLLFLIQLADFPIIQNQIQKLTDLSSLTNTIRRALVEDPPFKLSDGNIFKTGYHAELDELKQISSSSHEWIAAYQATLRETTQIKTLKVGFTQAFGYYIEVSRGQANKIPDSFQRRQTLVNTERFITPELREYEHKVLSAEEKIAAIELYLFQELKQEIASYAAQIRDIASAIAHIDCLLSLAKVAKKNTFVRPEVNEGIELHIQDGRHPVIEASLRSESFIPNDLVMDPVSQRLLIITGPNMAGKSTFIRQAALIVILAQMGSFVPASFAKIGLVDKVFTRIGASDNLARGQSTFMVEMAETANILHNATDRSLVILDEIGRGTSTYDGISIAWSVAEYLLTEPGKRAKTLFATHYYELIQLEEKISGAVNYHIAVHESDTGIVFLRKIRKGATDKSYGIHVAKLAGLPSSVLKKAEQLLKSLETLSTKKQISPPKQNHQQLSLPLSKSKNDFIIEEIKSLDLNRLTPIEALITLSKWKGDLSS